MPILTIDDRCISYEDYGTGNIIMLIHGSPGNARSWAPVGKRLAGQYHVIAPDLPGYGATTPQPYEQEPNVGYASELVETLIRNVRSPVVLAGHSYGGVVALAIALRGYVHVGALVLFEPVAMKILAMANEAEAYATAQTVFGDYISSFESGNDRAVQKMIDFWFGKGTFSKMPEPLTAYLIKETASNIRDVRATFRENYSVDALRKLRMPVVVVVGDRSPDITHRIARSIAEHVPHGSVIKLAGANHTLTTTHTDDVAKIIASATNDVERCNKSQK